MGSFEKMSVDFSKVRQEIEAGMLIRARAAGGDAVALVADRVRNTGKDSKGAQFTPYSTRPLQAWKLIGKSRTSSAESQVQQLAKQRGLISYKDFRQLNGLKVDVKNFEFTGEMFRFFDVKAVELKGDFILVTCGGTSQASEQKITWGSEREGQSIIDISDAELKLIEQTLRDWVDGVIKKHIR